jgi:5S rRNA maturation endonuclease (ribonuclease M5)
MTIFKDGGWKCWTSNCNEKWGTQLDGLVRGLGADPEKLLAGVQYNVQYNPEEIDLNLPVLSITREELRTRLKIPSPYYLQRGVSAELLDRFDVGDCCKAQMKNRAVFPIYNKDWGLLGCAGRTTLDKSYIQKWKYSKGLKSSRTFFALNHAHDSLVAKKTAIIVEGQSDTMALQGFGITNAVGAFGAKLSIGQAKLLKELGVTNIVLALDPDKPKERNGKMIEGTGPMKTRQIIKQYEDRFNITPVTLQGDPDEMTHSDAERYFGKYV